MNAQNIINNIEREEEQFKQYQQKEVYGLGLQVLNEMTIKEIKIKTEEINIRLQQIKTDKNISSLLVKDKRELALNKYLRGLKR